MILAHRILLQPTPAQAAMFEQTCEVCRVAWNWALRRWEELYGYGRGFPLRE
jgi:Helix-turn-helix domain